MTFRLHPVGTHGSSSASDPLDPHAAGGDGTRIRAPRGEIPTTLEPDSDSAHVRQLDDGTRPFPVLWAGGSAVSPAAFQRALEARPRPPSHHDAGGQTLTATRDKDAAARAVDVGREDLFEAEIHITAGTGEPGAGRRGRLIYVQLLAFLFGATLLVLLIRTVGVEPIFQALGQIGYGFFVLLGLAGGRHALRTLSMRAAVAREHRRFSFWQAYTTRLSGETISFFTFTGPVLGEATKAALLRKSVPLPAAVQALAVDNLLYNLSVRLLSAARSSCPHLDMPSARGSADRHRRGDASSSVIVAAVTST